MVPVKNFIQYIDLYIGRKEESVRVYETNGERWEYAVALTPTNEFIQISFVNGIHTAKGGKHVEYILNQITRKLVEFIEKKKSDLKSLTRWSKQLWAIAQTFMDGAMCLRKESCASNQLSIVMLARAKMKHVRSLHRMMCDAGHLKSIENLHVLYFPTCGSQESLV